MSSSTLPTPQAAYMAAPSSGPNRRSPSRKVLVAAFAWTSPSGVTMSFSRPVTAPGSMTSAIP